MFGLTPNQVYGLTAIAVGIIGFLAMQYRAELGMAGDWLGGLFKRTATAPAASDDAIRQAIETLHKHPDAEVKRLAALAARRVTEVAFPVDATFSVRTGP